MQYKESTWHGASPPGGEAEHKPIWLIQVVHVHDGVVRWRGGVHLHRHRVLTQWSYACVQHAKLPAHERLVAHANRFVGWWEK